MRVSESQGPLRVRVVAGTRVILMAFDLDQAARPGLHGFAIKRGVVGSGHPPEFLKGIKYFKDLVPAPKKGDEYSSRQHPIQSFLWSDYAAQPDTEYDVTVIALYGDIHTMEERFSINFRVRTEKEKDKGHGVFFNRGAIASHALSTQFQNKQITSEMFNKVDATGQIIDPEVRWLSRGLAEACIDYINSTKAGEALRVCAYEFTYQPVLKALKRALDRGIDVQIIYHFTKKANDPNAKAIAQAGLPETKGGKKILFQRTRTKIPHNKFIVKLAGGTAQEVWTGSTNFTDTGFFGQTNVGHLVVNAGTAGTYLKYWQELADDPVHSAALTNAVKLAPNPPNAIAKSSIAEFYSPRIADNMLDWYGQRIDDTASLAAMTIPFNVAQGILTALGKTLDSMRLVILEDEPTKEVTDAEIRNKSRLVFSNGAILGKTFIKFKAGGGKVVPITHSKLEDWFVDEELARPINNGHVFFVHSKLLLIDPLSDDPLVCSGSANFSTNSLVANDENMLLIRGDTRIADIYLTEFDRIFRHFYTRDAINRFALHGDQDNPLLLDTGGTWIDPNFKPGTYKNNRRLMFFPASPPATSWSQNAGGDPDPFADEAARATAMRKKKSDAAKARTTAGPKTGAAKTGAKKKTAKSAVAERKIVKKTAAKKKAAPKRKSAPKKKVAKKKAPKKATKKKTARKKKRS